MLGVAELPRIGSGGISNHALVDGLFSNAPLPTPKRKAGIDLTAALTLLWGMLARPGFRLMPMIVLISHVGPFRRRLLSGRWLFGGMADLFTQPDTNRHARFTGRDLRNLAVFRRDTFYAPGGFT